MIRTWAGVIWVAMVGGLAGCAGPYVKAQQQYWQGNPDEAIVLLQPELDKAIEKDSDAKNLYLWDMGIYCFSIGNYECAIEDFRRSVSDYEQIDGAGKTIAKVFTSASSQKYVGDPVEVSVAYLFLGLAYYMTGDYQNALVGLRRSIEEDLCKDPGCEGDMGTTNFLLGECYARVGRWDDATVAYRRAVQYNPDLIPAYVALYWALQEQGRTSDVEAVLGEIQSRVEPAYFEAIRAHQGRGVTLVLFTERASAVRRDALTGAFRNRADFGQAIQAWQVTTRPTDMTCKLSMADRMHTHFKMQGGASNEAKQQATRYAASQAMQQIPCLAAFAPSTEADVRYWVTLPGYFYIGYVPLEPGTYDMSVSAFDQRFRPASHFAASWTGIEVKENHRALVLSSGYVRKALF